nr:wall-associated receptor kinase 2-like [Ipomoea batatas]
MPLIGNIQVFDISESHVWISNVVALRCYTSAGGFLGEIPAWTNLGSSSPYTFSDKNKFTLLGCQDAAVITANNPLTGKSFANGCPAACTKPEDVRVGSCLGTGGCCQITIPKGLKSFNISNMLSLNNHTGVWSFNPCSFAFLGEADRFSFRGVDDLRDLNFTRRIADSVPILLDWAIGNLTCDGAQKSNDYACQENSRCVDADNDSGGYRCTCDQGYQGNPYLSPGCQGSYRCSCPDGYSGDGKKNGSGCIAPNNNSEFPWIKFSVGLGVGFLSMVIGVTWLYLFIKKRRLIKLSEKFFQQNGGLILKQRITTTGDGIEAIKIFTANELEKATNHYSSDRELGRGGNGIVYKGILPDNHIVAIKKSKKRSEEETNLSAYMVISMHKNQLFKILDRRVLREGALDQTQKVAELAKRCLHMNGEDRPTMKEVAMELEALRKFNRQSWSRGEQVHEVFGGQMNDEDGPSDLYSLQINSSTFTSEYSGQYTSSTGMNLSTNNSRSHNIDGYPEWSNLSGACPSTRDWWDLRLGCVDKRRRPLAIRDRLAQGVD